MKHIKMMSLGELGAFIQDHLQGKGIAVILSGGAAVAFYSSNKYVSQDLDLINIYAIKRTVINEAMQEIGFYEEGRYFKHFDTEFLVEFPPGPLSIGAEPVKEIIEINLSTGILRIISPTDCVKDRLSAYYHWGDNQCLYQAILVSQEHDIDLDEVSRWSEIEGMGEKFKEIRGKLILKS